MAFLRISALILLALFFVTACANSKGGFVAAMPTQEKGSVVYLYRSHNTANALLTPELSIDGSKNIQMSNGEYRMLYLLPGMYRVSLQAIEGYTSAQQLMLKVNPDSVQYLRLDSFIQFDTGLRYSPYQRAFALQEIDAALAVGEITQCSDANSVSAENTVTAGNEKAADSQDREAQFSTDKTANPFSR